MPPCLVDGSFLSGPHPVFDLGEGLLDGVEVGGVGRQIPEPCTGRPDHLPDGGRLMRAEVVHDNDVAGLEHRHELLLDIGPEALAIDRPVENAWRGEAVEPQGTQEGQRTPMPVGRKGTQAFALRPPASERGHVGLDPGLIDEDQLVGIEARLPGTPTPPAACDVGTRLLKGEQRFF